MATLRGLFLADFEDFYAAVTKADTKLADFGMSADKLGPRLNAMVDSFSGRRVIQDATLMAEAIERVGGVSNLTEKELARVSGTATEAAAKLRAMGVDVPPGIQHIADATKHASEGWQGFVHEFNIKEAIEHPLDTAKEAMGAFAETMGPTAVAAVAAAGAIVAVGAAVFELAAKAAETGERLVDMSLKTGIEVGALSELKAAVEVTGGSVDTVTNAIFMFQKRLGEDTPQFDQGLKRIGVSLGEIQHLKPDEQFLTIGSALRAMADPVERNAAGAELFGRQFRELAPTIMKDLPGMVEGFQALGATWSEQDAKAAEEFEIASRRLKMEIDLVFQKLGKDLIPIIQKPLDLAVGTVGWFLTQSWFADAQRDLAAAHAALLIIQGDLGTLPGVTGPATTSVDALGLSTKQYTTVIDDQAKALTDEIVKGELFAGHLQHLRDALVPLTAEQKAWATEMLRGGDSTKEVASWLGVAEVAVKHFEAATRDAAKAETEWAAIEKLFFSQSLKNFKELETEQARVLKIRNQAVVDGNAQIMAAEATLHDFQMKDSMDVSTYQIMKIWEKADAEIRAFKGTEEQAQRHADAVYMIADHEAKAITDVMAVAVDAMASKAAAGLEAVVAKAVAASYTVNSAFSLSGSAGAGDMAAQAAARGGSIAYDSYHNPYIYIPGVNQPGVRAGGGPVRAGSSYVVGERGPELFTPDANGSILPNGGGGTTINNFYITQPLGTPDAIARAVLPSLQAAARNLGIRL